MSKLNRIYQRLKCVFGIHRFAKDRKPPTKLVKCVDCGKLEFNFNYPNELMRKALEEVNS